MVLTYLFSYTVTDILSRWDMMGIFSYVLPFLLIFAVIYGILSKSNIFGDNKGVNAIIALAVGLLSLVGDYVPMFFREIMPNIGIAIAILVAILVLIGLFYSESDPMGKTVKWIIFGIGLIAFLVVVYSSFENTTFIGGFFWQEYGSAIISLLILAGIIALVITGGKKKA